jgi:hypothetical protein
MVSGPHPRDRRGRRGVAARWPAGHGNRAQAAEGDGVHRCAACPSDGPRRGAAAPRPRQSGGSGGVQAGRYLRRRVRGADALYVFHLRGARDGRCGMRGAPQRAQEGRDPWRRAEPDRAGDRVRLLLLPCLFRAQRCGVRDDHDQLQPRNRVDRLRHFGPALFRTADAGACAGNPAGGAGRRHAGGGDRAIWRPDAAETRPWAGGRRHPDPGHQARGDRPGRGSRAVSAAACTRMG